MKASFPTAFKGHFLGRSRNAGGFDSPDGRVDYGAAYEIAFESSEGLSQVVQVSDKQFIEAGDGRNPENVPRFTEVEVEGDVNINTDAGRSSFRPTSIKLAA